MFLFISGECDMDFIRIEYASCAALSQGKSFQTSIAGTHKSS